MPAPKSQSESLKFALDHNSVVPLYLQFKEQLLVQILDHRLAPGSRLPDIRTLTKLANTSLKTVNKGLNELLRERVCVRSPKHGTFVAEEVPVQLPPTKRRRICLLYHKTSKERLLYDPIRQELTRGINQACQELDIDLICITGSPIPKIEFYNSQKQFEIVGLLMLESIDADRQTISMANAFPDLRFVYFNDYCDAFELSSRNVYGIFHDDFSGGYGVGEYLAANHPKCFACISLDQKVKTYTFRCEGFKQAIKENGYAPDKDVIDYASKPLFDHSKFSEGLKKYGADAIQEVLKKRPEVNAVFVVNDVIAAGVADVLRQRGLEDKVMLFGYDNIISDLSNSHHFSTVDINFFRMGYRGVELIANSNYIPKSVFLPPRFICRFPAKSAKQLDW